LKTDSLPLDFTLFLSLSLKKKNKGMKGETLVIAGLGIGLLALSTSKSTAATTKTTTPPITTLPTKSNEELFENYNSAIRNVFENYNRVSDDFNVDVVLKFSQKIVDLGIAKQPLKRYYSELLKERADIYIKNSNLSAKQIITNLETKLYKLYA
jgi:hypothetical protein